MTFCGPTAIAIHDNGQMAQRVCMVAQTQRFATARSLSPAMREKDFVSWSTLDLQNLQFLGFPDFLHLIDETVGELL